MHLTKAQLRASRNETRDTRLIHAVIGKADDAALDFIQTRYADLIGRKVSHSVVIRRALDLLMQKITRARTKTAVAAELSALIRHTR